MVTSSRPDRFGRAVESVDTEGLVEMSEDLEKAGAVPTSGPATGQATTKVDADLAQARAQANEYLGQWRRTAADFANYRKRVEREREALSRFSSALLLRRLMPVLDDFERAMATLPQELRLFTWFEGIALIQRKLEMILESEGLKPIMAVGQPFDPTRHEAVLREETTAYPDGQVIAELQRGYELYGRVLRPSLVKVAAAPAPGQPAEPPVEPPAEQPSGQEKSAS